MKSVKINFCGIPKNANPKENIFCWLLERNGYQVEISEDPDYLICDFFDRNPYQYCGTKPIRLMYSGENYIPDLNLIDYAITAYPIRLGDRLFHMPTCVWPREHWLALPGKDRNYPPEILKQKEYFANFIAGHESEFGIRGGFFQKLCAYKRVESPGSYLNNMPDGQTVNWTNDSKTDFQRKCKFTLCFESTKHYGFVTEKIMDAFYADTIPVYYGSPTVTDIFNKNAFIDISDFDSFDAAIERIKELDQDDEKYLQMLRQPILADPDYPRKLDEALDAFIRNIFDQPVEAAYRRSRVYHPERIDAFLSQVENKSTLTMRELLRLMLGKIKRKITGIFMPKQNTAD